MVMSPPFTRVGARGSNMEMHHQASPYLSVLDGLSARRARRARRRAGDSVCSRGAPAADKTFCANAGGFGVGRPLLVEVTGRSWSHFSSSHGRTNPGSRNRRKWAPPRRKATVPFAITTVGAIRSVYRRYDNVLRFGWQRHRPRDRTYPDVSRRRLEMIAVEAPNFVREYAQCERVRGSERAPPRPRHASTTRVCPFCLTY